MHYGTFIIYWCIQEGEGLLHACISSCKIKHLYKAFIIIFIFLAFIWPR